MRASLKRTGGALGLLVVALAVVAAGWWFRPWSDYSPSEVYAFSRTADRTVPYRIMHEVYPYREIAAAPDHTPLPRVSEPLDGEAIVLADARTTSLSAYAEANNATGFMVLSGGEVVLEEYFNGERATDRHTSWSIAKSVVATLIGRALMEGRIDSLDDPAATYALEYAGTPYGDVSLRHLLMMSSGIDFDEDYEVDGSDIRRLFFGTFFWNRDVDDIVREHGPDGPAGERFDYISSNTAVLAAALRGIYDAPLADVAAEKLFVPIGAGGGSWLTDRPDGKELGYCCIKLALEDFARLGQLYLDGGLAPNGERIVPEDWVAFVSTPPTPDHEPSGGRHGYGHHFWLPPDAEGEFTMSGFNGQVVWIDLPNDAVVVMTGADRSWPAARPDFVAIARALARAAATRRAPVEAAPA